MRLSTDELAVFAARRGRGRERVVHLRHRQPEDYEEMVITVPASRSAAKQFLVGSSICNTSATT